LLICDKYGQVEITPYFATSNTATKGLSLFKNKGKPC